MAIRNHTIRNLRPGEASVSHSGSNRRGVKAHSPSSNGKTTRQRRNRDAELLKDAVEHPGSKGIPDEAPEVSDKPNVGIPAESLDAGAEVLGEDLDRDPSTMSVGLDRPGPDSWVHMAIDRMLPVLMFPYKRKRTDAPTYYYIDRGQLRDKVQRRLQLVNVHLLFDVGGEGDAFLWVVPTSEFSPYNAAVNRALSRGKQYVAEHLFNFEYVQNTRKVNLRVRLPLDDDAAVVLPTRETGILLEEALGPERYIRDANHSMYRILTAGSRLP
jgi:hypothetical protein